MCFNICFPVFPGLAALWLHAAGDWGGALSVWAVWASACGQGTPIPLKQPEHNVVSAFLSEYTEVNVTFVSSKAY